MITNKIILVTGGDGFLASKLIENLILNKNMVISLTKRKIKYQFKNLKKNNKKLVNVAFNINNSNNLKNLVKKYKFDFCYHLAAITQVNQSKLDPDKTFKTNIIGTLNILNIFRLYSKKTNIIISSTFPPNIDLVNPNNKNELLTPYSASKLGVEFMAYSFIETYGMKIIITRFANIYGPGDSNKQRIIPSVILSLLDNKIPILRSNGEGIRSFIYIDDAIDAYLTLSKNMLKNINLKPYYLLSGKDSLKTVKVVKKILKLFGKNDKFFKISNTKIQEINYNKNLLKNNNKLRGWLPQTRLDEGLKTTIQWIKLNKKNSK